jgi:hypothetical protein
LDSDAMLGDRPVAETIAKGRSDPRSRSS